MISEIFSECKNHWKNAIKDKYHPFRYFVLSTIDFSNKINSRKVVLRKFDSENLNFSIFTDLRSKKVSDLKNTPSLKAGICSQTHNHKNPFKNSNIDYALRFSVCYQPMSIQFPQHKQMKLQHRLNIDERTSARVNHR